MSVASHDFDVERSLEQRIVELECRLVHQECATEELSSVVVGQGDVIDALTRQVRRLLERLREQEAGWEDSPQDSKPPPHY